MNISSISELIKKNPWIIVVAIILLTALPKFIVFVFALAIIAGLIRLMTTRGSALDI